MRAWARRIGWAVVLPLAAASVASAALWVRSHDRSDSITYHGEDGSWDVWAFTNADQLVCGLLSTRDERPLANPDACGWHANLGDKALPTGDWRNDWADFPAVRHSGGAAGFDWFIADGRPGTDFIFPRVRLVGVPLWFLTLAFGVIPSIAAWRATRRHRARRRRSAGLCESCGYDVRASPERCPECGTVVTPGALSHFKSAI